MRVGGIIGMGAKSQNKYILSRRKRGEVIEEAIDYFVVKSVIFTNNTAIFSICEVWLCGWQFVQYSDDL